MKKLFLGIVIAIVGMAVHAEAMYWQVGSWSYNNVEESGGEWTMARIQVVNSSDGSSLSPEAYLVMSDTTDTLLDKDATGAWFDLSNSSYDYADAAYSFVLELVNDDLQVQGTSERVNYNDIPASAKVASFDTVSGSSYTSWNAGSVTIPEPTSGLLMLLGASLLALRRRQA